MTNCDCGAVKTNQPGHSFWCSTQSPQKTKDYSDKFADFMTLINFGWAPTQYYYVTDDIDKLYKSNQYTSIISSAQAVDLLNTKPTSIAEMWIEDDCIYFNKIYDTLCSKMSKNSTLKVLRGI